MGKRGFFTFVLGTAAVAAGVGLVKKKGGLHVSFDIAPSYQKLYIDAAVLQIYAAKSASAFSGRSFFIV